MTDLADPSLCHSLMLCSDAIFLMAAGDALPIAVASMM